MKKNLSITLNAFHYPKHLLITNKPEIGSLWNEARLQVVFPLFLTTPLLEKKVEITIGTHEFVIFPSSAVNLSSLVGHKSRIH